MKEANARHLYLNLRQRSVAVLLLISLSILLALYWFALTQNQASQNLKPAQLDRNSSSSKYRLELNWENSFRIHFHELPWIIKLAITIDKKRPLLILYFQNRPNYFKKTRRSMERNIIYGILHSNYVSCPLFLEYSALSNKIAPKIGIIIYIFGFFFFFGMAGGP